MNMNIRRMILIIFVLSLAFFSCDNGSTSGSKSEFDGVLKITTVEALRYGPYDGDSREWWKILLDSNWDSKNTDDYEEPDRTGLIKNDFVLKIDGEVKGINEVVFFGDHFRLRIDKDALVIGEKYNIQVIYIANPNRECKVWNKNGDTYVFGNFDTGIKNVKAEKW